MPTTAHPLVADHAGPPLGLVARLRTESGANRRLGGKTSHRVPFCAMAEEPQKPSKIQLAVALANGAAPVCGRGTIDELRGGICDAMPDRAVSFMCATPKSP